MARVKIDEKAVRPVWIKYQRTKRRIYKNQLIETYLPLVRSVAERMLMTLPASVELGDLISMGTFGLLEAIDRYDLERGVLFKTYCVNRIRGAILDELRALDWVPRLVRHKSTTVDRTGGRLQSRLGRDATIFEMAEELGIEPHEYQRFEKDSKPVSMLSLSDDSSGDGSDDAGGGSRMVDLVKDDRGENPLSHVHKRDLRTLATKTLNKKEQIVVTLYYFEQLSMKEIAKVLGLTESRVCQIHSKVIQKLRSNFAEIRCDLFVT
ncbi:MAG: FliA/WhiG family RNA polymerase sigma factor [Planctomycetota bacterium]|jgi:RNA polymerase sigma factor for flagellar operon FliA